MPTIIPFTWTQGRSVQAWATSAPATGQWYIDRSDPDYINGVQLVYKVVPQWKVLDFTRTRDGNLLILVCGPTDTGERGLLRVYRGDGTPEPASVTDYVELEATNVSGAAIGVRSSGEVDVFYNHGGTIKSRVSSDGGETFGAATSHSLAGAGAVVFVPFQSSLAAATGTQFYTEAQTVGGYVHFDYLGGGNVALMVHGRLTGAVDGDLPHLALGEWDGSAWTFNTVGKASTAGSGVLVACRNGADLLTTVGIKKLKGLSKSGAFTADYTVVGGTRNPSGLSEIHNQALVTGGNGDQIVALDGSGIYLQRRLQAFELRAAQDAWVLTGSAANTSAELLKAWALAAFATGTAAYLLSRAGRARMRGDGRWELLYLNRSQQPEIIRFTKITRAVTPLTWY